MYEKKPDFLKKMKRPAEKWESLLALFLLGCILLDYPLLQVFSVDGMIWGIPVLYCYLFTSWLALILFAAWVVERRG